ncbi:MAG: YggS family pyridoxal phosphate enzyme [Acidimicrobiales bacterium]
MSQEHFDPASISGRLDCIHERIAATAMDPSIVTVVAVTKGFGADAVQAALQAGISEIGENYADELVAKARGIDDGNGSPSWHFLGAVQRNKVARLAPIVGWWQGVSRREEGRAIARCQPGASVLVQVDIAEIEGRGGCDPAAVPELVAALREEDLDVAGLMAVGAPGPPEASRPGFHRVAAMADGLGLRVRSMGMTGDLEVAVAEGSTMVRIGRGLFGERPLMRDTPHVHPAPESGTTL